MTLLASMALLAVLPSAVIGYVVYSMGRSTHVGQIAIHLNSLAADRELTTRLLIEKQRDALKFLARDPKAVRLARELTAGLGASSAGFLAKMVERSPFFIGLSVVDTASGRHRSAGKFQQGIIERAASDMRQAQGKTLVRMEAMPDGEGVLLIGQPVHGREESPGHSEILLGIARLTVFNDLYKNTGMLGATGESFLSDSSGIALTGLRYKSHEKADHPIDATAMLDCLAGNSKSFVITPDYVGVPTAMSYRPIEGYGGCVMVHMRAAEVMAPINALRNLVVAIVAAITAAVALAAFLVTRKLLLMDRERKRLADDLARHGSHLEEMVAERTKMNRLLGERTEELEAANRELGAFSYSVAHDLRSPLRSIDGYVQFLAEDYSDKFDDEGRRTLDSVRDNAQKMGRMIDDLLKLAHLSRYEIRLQYTDMGGLARSVVQEVMAAAPERMVEFNVKELPPARAEETLMRQVFLNLLSNAVKFTRPVERAVIEIGGESNEDENIYYVRDNGIGFDPQYLDKIFGVFERLHSGPEFEGTGVGLAIVQRVVHRHGGRVWAEARVNEGATFYFSIPK